MLKQRTAALVVTACLLGVSACSSGSAGSPPPSTSIPAGTNSAERNTTAQAGSDRFPDVVKAVATQEGGGTWSFAVTMTSPYDTPERYADGWRVKNGDEVLGEMTLGHDHASEQPFTRNQSGVKIPDAVKTVTIEGRDLKNGYGGAAVTLELPR